MFHIAVLVFMSQVAVPGAGEHPLQYNYTFWYSRRTPGRPASTQSYEQNIKQIGSFASVLYTYSCMQTHNESDINSHICNALGVGHMIDSSTGVLLL